MRNREPFCFSRPVYADSSSIPRWLEFGVLKGDQTFWVEVFGQLGSRSVIFMRAAATDSLEENSLSKNISTALPTNKNLTGLPATSPRRTLSPSSARIPRNPSAICRRCAGD
jgi:hypothetical protein